VELDHVLIAVADLASAGRELEARHGLVSVEGGRHPGWGTANRIVPLGETYLELIAAVDDEEAAASEVGRWVLSSAGPARPLGWAVRTATLDAVANRLHLAVRAGSRQAPDGQFVRWRTAGVERAAVEPSLPFFIEWAPAAAFPGRARVTHRHGSVSIDRLELVGDADRLAAWLGEESLPVVVRPGPPALAKVFLAGRDGEIALGAGY
jgi:hypothetical protein